MVTSKIKTLLFSNTLAPVIAATSIKAFKLVEEGKELRNRLRSNSKYFRTNLVAKGFNLSGDNHPIIPVIIKDALLAMADELNSKGVLVVSFSFPVVPKNKARIRVQISSSHTQEDLDTVIKHFEEIGKKLE